MHGSISCLQFFCTLWLNEAQPAQSSSSLKKEQIAMLALKLVFVVMQVLNETGHLPASLLTDAPK